jgi:hypothetical protein
LVLAFCLLAALAFAKGKKKTPKNNAGEDDRPPGDPRDESNRRKPSLTDGSADGSGKRLAED